MSRVGFTLQRRRTSAGQRKFLTLWVLGRCNDPLSRARAYANVVEFDSEEGW